MGRASRKVRDMEEGKRVSTSGSGAAGRSPGANDSRVTRTVVVKSAKLPRRVFRVFVEVEGMYRNMVEQLVLFAVRENIKSFIRLKALKYSELRRLYPHLPSHYAYTACQDAAARVKSFLRLKKKSLTNREYPEVRRVSIWLDDQLWRLDSLTAIEVATHRGWIAVELEPHKHFWKYINSGWRLASEARIKLDKRNRQLITYLTFTKDVGEFEPKGFISVALLFETSVKKLVLGYYYCRKSVQEKYYELYGARSRIKRKVLRKLKERKKKNDLRWKLANIIVRAAEERKCAIVLEKLGKKAADSMIARIGDKQLRHRIHQASFGGVQRAVEEKARERGVPILYVNPRNTSKLCPAHGAKIVYSNGSRVGKCTVGGETWHRDAAACTNLLLRALRGDGSNAPSPAGLAVDGSPVPLGSTAAHDPTPIAREAWARWKRALAARNFLKAV